MYSTVVSLWLIEELVCQQAPCSRSCRRERVPLGPRHPAGGADCHQRSAQGVVHDVVKPGGGQGDSKSV